MSLENLKLRTVSEEPALGFVEKFRLKLRSVPKEQYPIELPDGTLSWTHFFHQVSKFPMLLNRETVLQGRPIDGDRKAVLAALQDLGIKTDNGLLDPVEFPEIVEPSMQSICDPINRTDFMRTLCANEGFRGLKDSFLGANIMMTVALDSQNPKSTKFGQDLKCLLERFPIEFEGACMMPLAGKVPPFIQNPSERIVYDGFIAAFLPADSWFKKKNYRIRASHVFDLYYSLLKLQAGVSEGVSIDLVKAALPHLDQTKQDLFEYFETKPFERTYREFHKRVRVMAERLES